MNERATLTEQMEHWNEDNGRHPVHDLINQAERMAAYLRVMTAGELTLAVVRNIPPASETDGMHARMRVLEDRQGLPWGEAHEAAEKRAKLAGVPADEGTS